MGKLKLKKSLHRTFPENFSRISFFNGKKEARFNIKLSLQRKLTNMMSYIKFWALENVAVAGKWLFSKDDEGGDLNY